MNGRYSPDGKLIAFESARSGNTEIWTSQVDGQRQVPLTAMSAYCASPAWSPDGRRLAFESNAGGHWNIYTIGSTGENQEQLTKGPEMDSVPSWSRDGKWIYYASRSDGPYRVWKVPSQGGEALPVTRGLGYRAVESADGKSLIYTRDGGNPTGLWKLTFATGEEKAIAGPILRDSFLPVKDGVYYIAATSPRTLSFYSDRTVRHTVVRTFEHNPGPGIDASPDGAYALFTRRDQSGSDLMLVDSFR
jgi:Tol biopolymer transport system component